SRASGNIITPPASKICMKSSSCAEAGAVASSAKAAAGDSSAAAEISGRLIMRKCRELTGGPARRKRGGRRLRIAESRSRFSIRIVSAAGLKEKLRDVPHQPGVYLMKDRLGSIIYVGKARDLRKR